MNLKSFNPSLDLHQQIQGILQDETMDSATKQLLVDMVLADQGSEVPKDSDEAASMALIHQLVTDYSAHETSIHDTAILGSQEDQSSRQDHLNDSPQLLNQGQRPMQQFYDLTQFEPFICQLAGESVADFILRIPPSQTHISRGHWIYISDHKGHRIEANSHDDLSIQEACAPILSRLENDLADIANDDSIPVRAKAGVKTKKEVRQVRELTGKTDILAMAQTRGCTSGKWMLFVHETQIDEAWALVATETAKYHLGYASKVATNDGHSDLFLICVYTYDFNDLKDVRQVMYNQGNY